MSLFSIFSTDSVDSFLVNEYLRQCLDIQFTFLSENKCVRLPLCRDEMCENIFEGALVNSDQSFDISIKQPKIMKFSRKNEFYSINLHSRNYNMPSIINSIFWKS